MDANTGCHRSCLVAGIGKYSMRLSDLSDLGSYHGVSWLCILYTDTFDATSLENASTLPDLVGPFHRRIQRICGFATRIALIGVHDTTQPQAFDEDQQSL